MNQWQEAQKTVLQAAWKMLEKGLVVGTSGNISLRLPPDGKKQLMAITPTSRHYDTLSANDIPIIDFNGQRVEGKLPPSIETTMHVGIYRARKDVNAIIHTHSVYASAASVAGTNIPPLLEDQVVFLGGEIKVAGYAPSGSPELVINSVAALGERNAVLLANHGAVGTGRTMRDAFTACELIEKTAKVYFLTALAGKVNQLPEKAIAIQKELYTRLQTGKE
ncbi:MAG: class II aldolase/adducin family protein [Dehalococcoidales bacterium]|nr:class II aldolase/adducin family protein [Dehalococcoidales bacterium]